MVVATRQRREKPTKIEERKVWGPEWEPQLKQTPLLASPVYIGQAQGEEKRNIKGRAKIESLASLLFASFGSACPSALRMYFPLLSKWNWAVTRGCITLVCLRAITLLTLAVTLVCLFKFWLWWDRTKEVTHSPDTLVSWKPTEKKVN